MRTVPQVPEFGFGYAIPAQVSSVADESWLRPLVILLPARWLDAVPQVFSLKLPSQTYVDWRTAVSVLGESPVAV